MQEEVDQKTIALAVKTGKLTAQVLQAAIRKYLAARQKGTGKAHHGQQSLRQLKKDGSALSNIEITDANIGLKQVYSVQQGQCGMESHCWKFHLGPYLWVRRAMR